MKAITPPKIDDIEKLCSMATDKRLSSYPELSVNYNRIMFSYAKYKTSKGSALSPHLSKPLLLSKALKECLIGHYRNKISTLSFIDNWRGNLTPDVCPMCGSLGKGTIDHFLPKDQYPEFACFSLNLIPTCLCNSSRSNDSKNCAPNQSLFHPYFDTIYKLRLVRANITQPVGGDLKTPDLSLSILLNKADCDYEAVRYHVDSVVMSNRVLDYFGKLWRKAESQPNSMFREADSLLTQNDFKREVIKTLKFSDLKYGTKNNWDSMFYAGILASKEAIKYLFNRIVDLRTGVALPED